MIPNEQIKLLEAWKKQLFEELSISEIMKVSRKRTKPWVFNALKELTKNGLLAARRKANINLYRLNLDNPFLIQTLQYLEAQSNLGLPYSRVISELIRKIPVMGYCLLAFEDKKVELCFLIDGKEMGKEIRKRVDKVSFKAHYIVFDDFVDMLLKEGEDIAKKIFSNHKLFFNADIFYGLVKEAYRNGFRG